MFVLEVQSEQEIGLIKSVGQDNKGKVKREKVRRYVIQKVPTLCYYSVLCFLDPLILFSWKEQNNGGDADHVGAVAQMVEASISRDKEKLGEYMHLNSFTQLLTVILPSSQIYGNIEKTTNDKFLLICRSLLMMIFLLKNHFGNKVVLCRITQV